MAGNNQQSTEMERGRGGVGGPSSSSITGKRVRAPAKRPRQQRQEIVDLVSGDSSSASDDGDSDSTEAARPARRRRTVLSISSDSTSPSGQGHRERQRQQQSRRRQQPGEPTTTGNVPAARLDQLSPEERGLVTAATLGSLDGIVVDHTFAPIAPSAPQHQVIDRGLGACLLECQIVTLLVRTGKPLDIDRQPAHRDDVPFDVSAAPPGLVERITAICLNGFKRERQHRDRDRDRLARELLPAHLATRLPLLDFSQLNAFDRIRRVYVDASGPDYNAASVWYLALDEVSQRARGQRLAALTFRFTLIVNLNAWLEGGDRPLHDGDDTLAIMPDPGFATRRFRLRFDASARTRLGIMVSAHWLDPMANRRGVRKARGGTRTRLTDSLARYWLRAVRENFAEYQDRGMVYQGYAGSEDDGSGDDDGSEKDNGAREGKESGKGKEKKTTGQGKREREDWDWRWYRP